MTPRLHDFSHGSKKIPSHLLDGRPVKPNFEIIKFLAAHLIDFGVVYFSQFILTQFLSIAFLNLIPTSTLRSEFETIGIENLGNALMPFLISGYYFFCNFFNEGQTYGMSKLNKRIEMPQKDFGASLNWALKSTFIIFSCGTSFLLTKNSFVTSFVNQDHLYHTFMFQKEWKAPSLVEMAQENTETVYEEEFQQAA